MIGASPLILILAHMISSILAFSSNILNQGMLIEETITYKDHVLSPVIDSGK